MNDRFLEAKFQECLLGVQIGDAMGMPVEIMTPEEILAATDGKGVTDFIDPVQRRIHDTMDLKAGDTTDDWQLTQVVAESLISVGGYNQADQARRHIKAMQASRFGWGGTTTKGIQSLIDGRDPDMPPPSLGNGRGCGNGVAMKIAPIALFCSGLPSEELLLPMVMAHGRLTHPDMRASVAAYSLAYAIRHIIRTPLLRGGGWTMNRAREAFVTDVITATCDAEERFSDEENELRGSVSFVLDRAYRAMSDAETLRDTVGTGCIATESVPFAVATFARHFDDFKGGVLEAVNAGGDTDTIASMVGALVGANGGGQSHTARCVPMTWTDRLHDKGKTAKRLGTRLYQAVLAFR